MINVDNFNLYTKGTFSGSLECPLYTGLTVQIKKNNTKKITISILQLSMLCNRTTSTLVTLGISIKKDTQV